MKKLIVSLFLFSLQQFSFAQDGNLPVIDVHIHSRTKADRNEKGEVLPRFCFPEPCEKIPAVIKKDEDILRMTLEAMKKYNIVKGVISHYGMENVFAWKKADPNRFIAGMVYGPPHYTNDSIADGPLYIDIAAIRRELKKGNLKVIGEVTSQYFNYAADDPALDPLFSLAEEFDVPVHIHCAGLGGSADFPIMKGSPLRISEVIRKHPKLRIYLENAGWPFWKISPPSCMYIRMYMLNFLPSPGSFPGKLFIIT
jgi:predicted TIM-barrel fold metal-dependent hydrolase